MAHEFPYAPRLSAFEMWIRRVWPARRLLRDPLATLRVAGRYAPVSIANWKLTPSMRRRLLDQRVAQPLTFAADRRLTVIIPFRDRDAHLHQLLQPLTETLQSQGLEHQILVVEQAAPGLFNRGRLLNIGAHYAADSSDYFCLHDVDAVPVKANYACPSQPLRLVDTIEGEAGVTRRAAHYFSGAVSIRKEQMFAANGYSNDYWGWGKEDDDFFFRLLLAGYLCYYDTAGVFLDLPNPQQQRVSRKGRSVAWYVKANRRRRSILLRGLMEPCHDGLSTVRYSVLSTDDCGAYTKIRVQW